MVIGLLQVDLYFAESGALKSKRFIIKSLIDRLRRHFNVCVSEVEYQDLWQRSVIGIATINTDRKNADSTLSKVLDILEREGDLQVLDVQTEFL